MLAAFGITDAPAPNLERWQTISSAIANPEGEVTIAIVGKYTGLKDAYKSLIEALFHGGIANRVKVKLDWIESEIFEREDPAPYLENVHGILVPGGFGERGSEGKILAARFARERNVPYFGICFGMQMAVIEAARNLVGIKQGRLHRVRAERGAGRRPDDRVDARQRAGEARAKAAISAAPCGSAPIRRSSPRAARSPRSTATRRSPSATATATRSTSRYRERLEEAGLRFCGLSPDGLLPEIIELPGPPLVHRRAVPPRAESRARSSRTRCSRASSRRRWSRAGWCNRIMPLPSRRRSTLPKPCSDLRSPQPSVL